MEKSNKTLLSKYEVSMIGVLMTTLLPTFYVLFFQIIMDLKAGEMNNFRIYFVSGIAFFVFLFLSVLIFIKYAEEVLISRKILCVSTTVLFVLQFLLLGKCYLNSETVYPAMSGLWFPWHSKSNWKVFCLMLGIGVAGSLVFLWAEKQRKLIEIIRYPVYLLAAVIAGFSMYAPNWAANDRMHGSAYYVSVYNALMNEPYTYSNQSIYGHYAILLKYPIKWLGGDYRAFNIVISIVGGLSLFFVALALDLCIKNHFIAMIAVWAVPVMFLYYPLNHWQMFPHRVVFAGVELYLIAALFYKKRVVIKLIGYIVCCFSMLWNVETGIVCLGVWAVVCIVYENLYLRTKWDWKLFLRNVFLNGMYSVFTVMGLIGIFNLYNMPLGEQWHGLRFVLYPHIASWDRQEKLLVQAAEQVVRNGADRVASVGNSSASWGGGFASGLAIQFPIQISYWYFVLLLMGGTVVLYVVKLVYRCADKNDYVMGLASILALGHLTYFMNRPCFDYLAIAFFEAVVIMAIIADRKGKKSGGLTYAERGMKMSFVIVLSILSILTVWQAYFRISGRIEDGYYDRDELRKIVEQVEKGVPQNTYAIGMGIQEMYAELGWDTQIHVTDFMAIDCTGGDGLATLVVETAKQEECVICYRSKKTEERQTAYDYMRNYGFAEEAITIKGFWDLEIDENWYWNIYYLGLDPGIKNNQVGHYRTLLR